MEKTKYGPFHKEFTIAMTVCGIYLHHVFGGTAVWVHAKPSPNINNGRYAFFLLKNFFLGPRYVTHMAAQLDLNIRSFSYDGEKRGSTFQKFVNLHKVKHMIVDGLMEYGYSGVDYNYKVGILMNGSNTNTLNNCKEAILASPDMQGYFDIVARHFIDFIVMTPYL